jgi:hypothetical protein
MPPSKNKRKIQESKGTTNGNEKNEKETLVESGSDYESDEVSFVVSTCAFIYNRLL